MSIAIPVFCLVGAVLLAVLYYRHLKQMDDIHRKSQQALGEKLMTPTHEFCDTCPGCQPALIDTTTGKTVPDDKEPMLSVNRVWRTETSYAERRAYIMVTVHSSRVPEDRRLASLVVDKFTAACAGDVAPLN